MPRSTFRAISIPPHDVRFGEELIADVYNTLQSSPAWKNTLLVIIYDEHGGCYDHVPPPAAVPPEPPRPDQVFAFDRYGIRIPAVVISPYIRSGTVFRAPSDSQPFDHTSVIATIRRCFDLGEPLTDRDRTAPDLSVLLPLPDDQLNLGEPLELPSVDRAPELLQKLKNAGLSDLQKSLHAIAAHLPDLVGLDDAAVQVAKVEQEISRLTLSDIVIPEHHTLDEVLSYVHAKLNAFQASLDE